MMRHKRTSKQRQPNFLSRAEVAQRFEGKTVAVVGGGPGAFDNPLGRVDSFDIVVRVNNYRLMGGTGHRCDVFYSFFGTSIRKTPGELRRDGVSLCIAKCPNAMPFESEWHRQNNRLMGIDYRMIYGRRSGWWFCDTYIPEVEEFMQVFNLLGGHVPTTGFSAILDVLSFGPRSVLLTGFDFFRSGRHNLTESWRPKNYDDPIRHMPEFERQWLLKNIGRFPVIVDKRLGDALEGREVDFRLQRQDVSGVHPPRQRSKVRHRGRPALLPRRRFRRGRWEVAAPRSQVNRLNERAGRNETARGET